MSRHDAVAAVIGHVNHPQSSAGDDVILNFPDGIWIRSAYQADAVQLHPLPAQAMSVADFDPPGRVGHNTEDVAISFANGLGTWIYRTNLAWVPVHPLSAVQMAAGDLDANGVADLVLDFGPGYGIWIYSNLTSWRFLHPSTSRHIVVADLDGNGVKDIIVDFGPSAGIWVFKNNSNWYQLTALSARQIVTAHLKSPSPMTSPTVTQRQSPRPCSWTDGWFDRDEI
jgi:hypothetical protein